MSRWVRCSYGKRAGFVSAKIGIISEYSKFFEVFLLFLCKNWFRKACERLFYVLFLYKAIDIPKKFVSLHRFLNNAEAQGWRLRDGNLYIGKALLDALCLTARNLAVPKLSVKDQSNNDAHGYVVSDK